jgi:class 3 adenylate cyclase/tetratricopeptide (TPR) repeat protein
MKCPKCQFVNAEGLKFCGECGAKLERVCPKCNSPNPPQFKFCGECGQELGEGAQKEKILPEREGERKYVTAMFSDLSGYTAMSEKLDPEEVKEIMSRIFGEIAQVVARYEGFIEKFIGDAVVAFFGVPKAHEDDPIRAIKVAREIHELVGAMSPEVEKRTGRSISMHTGINTGLVVTGEVNTEKGTHGLAGDTINMASRLSSLAKAGEIVVGHETYRQAEGHFTFEDLEPTTLKGKTEPVQLHKVISPKERPVTIHRLSGLKAHLIGRKAELTQLREAVENLRKGRGRIFSICGDAGTGKSRLIEEFKSSLNLEDIQWIEGHSYAYSQNIPYFPLIDLLNRVMGIEEGDPPLKVKEKLEWSIERLIEKKESIVPFVSSLYSLRYPEVEDVSPEFWKSRLQDAIQTILSALANKAPTIFFHEDLHWADPSFVELLRKALTEIQQPAIVLCAYRPTFSLFTSDQLRGMGKIYQEIRLEDLSYSEAEDMLESLLKTESIPSDLKRFVQDKAEGNPFYLEELINSLIESEALVRDNGSWKIRRAIAESDISPTIHGLISGRLDRLEKETKRILQEASVIGRAFLYDILKGITDMDERIDRGLSTLERLDFIRTRSLQPELEYMFKHPLTQEVVYNSLLKKERQEIHEQIGLVMEGFFQERLTESYETLAFHFKQGRSVHKAVDYLVRSGGKSLKRYAVEESHQYYKEAFDLLSNKPEKSREENGLLIDLLTKWALVFYYRGDFRGLTDLLIAHEELARSLDDKARLGMFLAWLGFTWHCRSQTGDSYDYLSAALKIGEEINDQKLIGYSCAWLAWTCLGLGLHKEAIAFGERAQEISKLFESDQYLYFKSLGGIGMVYSHMGERRRTFEAGEALLTYGHKHSNIRSQTLGLGLISYACLLDGDFSEAIERCKEALRIAKDPFYSQIARTYFGIWSFMSGNLQDAEEALTEVFEFGKRFGAEVIAANAQAFLGAVLVAKGQMSQGLKMLEELRVASLRDRNRFNYATTEYILGNVYLQIVQGGEERISLSTAARNIGFLIRQVPFATKKAEDHFNESIRVAKEVGIKSILGQAYLNLGLLHKVKGRADKAKECISNALGVFEQCDAELYLKQAREALASLESV